MNGATTSTEPKLLTTRQVSEIVGKSVLALQMMRHRKQGIPFQKVGRTVRYLESDVLVWLDKQTSTKPSQPTVDTKPKRKSKKKIVSALNLSKPQLGRLNKLIATADNERDIKISTLIAARLISVRLGNVLTSLDIKTIDDLVNMAHGKLAHARNCGKKTEREVKTLILIFKTHPRNAVLIEPGRDVEVSVAARPVKVVPAPIVIDELLTPEERSQKYKPAPQKPLPIPPIDPTDIVQDGIDIKQEKKPEMGLFSLVKAYIRSRLPRRLSFGERGGVDINEIVAIGAILEEDYGDKKQYAFTILFFSGFLRSYYTDETFNKSMLANLREEIVNEWLK